MADTKVEEVFEGPTLDHDALMSQFANRSAEEYARSSDAGESAAQTKQFLEETGLNSQAFSWLKAIFKKLPKKDGQSKAMDVIRSLYAGLPMVEAHVMGQGTAEMDLGEPTADLETPPDEDEGEIEADDAEFLAATDDLDDGDDPDFGDIPDDDDNVVPMEAAE